MAAGEEEGAGAGVASAAALRRYKAAGGLNLCAAILPSTGRLLGQLMQPALNIKFILKKGGWLVLNAVLRAAQRASVPSP